MSGPKPETAAAIFKVLNSKWYSKQDEHPFGLARVPYEGSNQLLAFVDNPRDPGNSLQSMKEFLKFVAVGDHVTLRIIEVNDPAHRMSYYEAITRHYDFICGIQQSSGIESNYCVQLDQIFAALATIHKVEVERIALTQAEAPSFDHICWLYDHDSLEREIMGANRDRATTLMSATG